MGIINSGVSGFFFHVPLRYTSISYHRYFFALRVVPQEYYEGLGALNLGVAADQTQHLLWRMQNGELPDVLQPQVGAPSVIAVILAAFHVSFFPEDWSWQQLLRFPLLLLLS